MAGKKALDAIEDSLEVIEKSLDKIEDPVAYIADQRAQLMVSGAVVGLGLGLAVGTVGYILAKKRLQTKYDQILEEERLEMKEYYERHYKKGDFETPQATVSKLGVDVDKVVGVMRDYRGEGARSVDAGETEEVVIAEEETDVEVTPTRNVFTENESNQVWDQEQEESKREANPDDPFVITNDEFHENEHDYVQNTLTYFAEDDVLVDEAEKPIEEIDNVVGEGNLLRFGHGSGDNRIVYVRNNRLSFDFEIVKKDGSYSREVLGFQHDADGSRKTRRFRGVDE